MPTGPIAADNYIDDPNRTTEEVQDALNQIFDYVRSLKAEVDVLSSTVVREAAVRGVGSGLTQVPDNTELNTRLGTTGNLGNAAQKNEGPGGGLDADTVDGVHGTDLALKAVSISAGGGLTGGGDLSANRTISHADTSSAGSVNNSGLTFIQDVTIDGYGHVTGLASASVTLANVNSGATAGAVGSYATLINTTATNFSQGATTAGSNLLYAACGGSDGITPASPGGTWRCMGVAFNTASSEPNRTAIWLRIS